MGKSGLRQDSSRDAEEIPRTGCFGALSTLPNEPWELAWFGTVKGSEWVHLYLWMAKDLSWAQGWYFLGLIFGVSAVLWSVYLLNESVRLTNYVEAWHYVAQFLWLFGNFWWMWGDLHDSSYPSETKIYPAAKLQAAVVFIAAMAWLVLYYALVRPLKLLPAPSVEADYKYSQSQVKPPAHLHLLFLFPTWRQYEHIHILLWLRKDTANCLVWPGTWCVLTILTLLVALDFAATTSFYRGMAVDHVHYVAQLLWVAAAAAWAGDELLLRRSEDDPAVPLLSLAPAELGSGRWYCACTLILALALVATLHAAWLALSDRIRHSPAPRPSPYAPP